MSFGTFERKVRDPSLAYGRRVNALAGCVQRYRPIGFRATFGYLIHVAGPFRHDEAALLRAIDALSSSRDLWLVELGDYARQRQEAKRAGRRTPQRHEVNLSSPVCWYGDARNAAVFALGLLRRADRGGSPRTGTADADVLRLSSACVDRGGHLSGAEREQVRLLRIRFQRLWQESRWPDIDRPDVDRARTSLWILQLIAGACSQDVVDNLNRASHRS